MGVAERIEDARCLWANDRREGALLSLLVAFAATAKRVRPNLTDREAFEALYRDHIQSTINVEFRGHLWPIETILYKWFRCELVHTGGLPIDTEIIDNGNTSIRAGGTPQYTLQIGTGWYDFLATAVMTCPANADAFPASPVSTDPSMRDLADANRDATPSIEHLQPGRDAGCDAKWSCTE